MSDSSNQQELWSTIGFDERPVFLKPSSLQHIKDQRVNITLSDEEWSTAIKETIEEVDFVATTEFEDRLIHIKKMKNIDALKGQYLNVPVMYQSGQGDVQTAIPTADKMKGKKLVYIRPDVWDDD